MAELKKFPDIRRFAWSSSKKQEWNTTIQKSASGRVRTMTNQLYPSWTISASYNAITDAEANTLLGFVAQVKGSFEPFLWLDPEDYKAEGIRLAEVSAGKYQAVIQIGEHAEPAEYIDDVTVYVDGVEQAASAYTVSDGMITLKTPLSSGVLTADYTYYWKVIFDEDGLTVTKVFQNINKCSLKMAVVR